MDNTKRYSPTKNYITPLTKVLQNDKLATTTISDDLKKRGYTFVRLPLSIVKLIDECVRRIEYFFDKNISYKREYEKEPVFGYYDVPHKESFRFLTGLRLDEQKIPSYFEPIKNLIHTIDHIMYTLTLICSNHLFPEIIEKAHQYDIPMFQLEKSRTGSSQSYNTGWAMFDIVKYHNDGTRKELNCKEHIDPGLLSFSLRSTEPGLQLKDEHGEWISLPIDNTVGIIWAGEAATKINPEIKPGYHRVINPKPIYDSVGTAIPKPRISMWHEICTSKQERKDLLIDKEKNNDFELSDKLGNLMKERRSQNITGIPAYKSITESTRSNDSKLENLMKERRSQSITGYKSIENIPKTNLKPGWGRMERMGYDKLIKARKNEAMTGIPITKAITSIPITKARN